MIKFKVSDRYVILLNLIRAIKMIMSLDEIFDINKPIIGVVHLNPLPGSPLFDGDLNEIIEAALKDARTLISGGVDGILVENFNDKPYEKRVRDPETISAMAIIVNEIIKNSPIPVGINLLRNSAIEASSIAYVTKAMFIRVNALVENIETDSGIIEAIAPKLMRHIKKLNAKLGILADIHVKHASPIGNRDIEVIYMDIFERGLASAAIITGKRTGEAPDINILKLLRRINRGPVLIGSGLSLENLGILEYADGAIVGTYFKRDSNVNNEVNQKRVKIFMEKVKLLRKKNLN